ncbi:MAG: DUF1579 family protein [Chloroflexia bacterium]
MAKTKKAPKVHSMDKSTKSRKPEANVKSLDILVGTWDMDLPEAGDPEVRVHGSVTFEWMAGGHYLIESSASDHELYPDSLSVIGFDETTGNFKQHYFDSRGVERIYGASLMNKVLRFWRDSPGFSQRFTGKISDHGRLMTGRWEKSVDGATWETDFDLSYTKRK